MAVLSVDALPLGFRFRPTDVELVNHYLKGKIRGRLRSAVELEVIPEIDICKCEPWDLPGKSLIKSSDPEWFFFSPKDRKYANGHRSNRATRAGYWKATGKDRKIKSPSKGSVLIGMKRTLVFYHGRAPKGVRSNWIIHEYRTTESEFCSGQQGGFVLCRLFRKSEDSISTSDVNVCAKRNDDEAKGLSPTITRSSLGEIAHGGEATVEGPNPLDQNFILLEMQADSQNLRLNSNMQPSSTNMLLEDGIECGSLNLDENYCSSTAASYNAYKEIDVEGVEVADLLGDLAEMSDLDHVPMLPEISNADGYDNGLQPSLLQNVSKTDDDYITEFLDTLFNTEEFLPETSNVIVESSTDFVPDGQKCMTADHSANEGKRCSNEVVRGTNALEDVGLPEVLGEPFSYPSYSSNINNCLLHMLESKNQVTYEQNACSLDYSDDPLYHEFQSLIEPMRVEFSRDMSNNNETEPINANLDNTGIQIRARQNLSSSEDFVEHQGLAMRRVRLQKSMHNASVARTENESITFSRNVHKSIISEVGKYEKKRADEGTFDVGSGYVDNAMNTFGGNIRSTSDQDKRNIADTSSISSELSHELSKSNLSKKWAPETAGKSKVRAGKSALWIGSNSILRVMIIMLTILLFVMIIWTVMK